MIDITTPIVIAEEVAEIHRFNEEEYPFIEQAILGAQALLHNAGAFHPYNAMTSVVIIMLVGHWLENRDAMNYDYKHANDLPFSLKAMITSLQYLPTEVKGDVNG